MKKYITIATLLVAGTAFANAAEVTASAILTFDDSLDGGASLTNSVVGSTATISLNGSGYRNYAEYSYVGEEGYSFVSNVDGLYGVKISNAISWDQDFTISVAVKNTHVNGSAWKNILQVGGPTNHVRIQNNDSDGNKSGVGLYGNGSLSADQGVLNTIQHNSSSLSSESFVLLSLVYTVEDEKGYLKLYTDGELQAESQTGWTVNNSVATDIYIGKGISGNAWGGTFDELSVYNGALTQQQIKTYLVGKSAPSAIPEPSTFGLLAGLGALALVGTRRRRR